MDELEHIFQQLENERKTLLEALGEGSAKDYAGYQHTVGVVRGLLTAQSFISALQKDMETSDE